MSIVVTGASGFVGSAIARKLVSLGHEVVTVGRTQPEFASPAGGDLGLPKTRRHAGAFHVDWDITQPAPAQVSERAAAAHVVIHAAGAHDDWMTRDFAHAVNVTGTRNVLDAFPDARFIHVSCASVYDPQADWNETYEEAAPVDARRYTSQMELSLVGAESVVNRVRPAAVLLRPGFVYGNGDTRNVPYLVRRIHRGTLTLPGGGENLMTLCHIDNLVAAALGAIEFSHVSGPINVGDAQPYTLKDAINTLLARTEGQSIVKFEPVAADLSLLKAWAWERRAKLRGGPRVVERAQASGDAQAVRRANKRARPPMTRYAVRNFIHDRTLNLSRLVTLLGVEPVQGLAPADE